MVISRLADEHQFLEIRVAPVLGLMLEATNALPGYLPFHRIEFAPSSP
jgi:hypothetical protein